jgi:hypothetical protein
MLALSVGLWADSHASCEALPVVARRFDLNDAGVEQSSRLVSHFAQRPEVLPDQRRTPGRRSTDGVAHSDIQTPPHTGGQLRAPRDPKQLLALHDEVACRHHPPGHPLRIAKGMPPAAVPAATDRPTFAAASWGKIPVVVEIPALVTPDWAGNGEPHSALLMQTVLR